MILTVQFLQAEPVSLSQQIVELERQLNESMGQEETLKIKNSCQEKFVTYKKNIEACKRSKLERDCDDYANNRVYNWTEPNRFGNRPFRNLRRNQQVSASTSSMASTCFSTNTQHGTFLEHSSTHPVQGEEEVRKAEKTRHKGIATLSDKELLVLNKGLNFCPKAKMDTFVLKQDLYRFFRQIRLKAYYSSKPVKYSCNTLPLSIHTVGLRNKSQFTPPTSCAAAEVEEEIGSFLRDSTKRDHIPNYLSREKLDTLASLSARPDITIKPTDKGGLIVIMDTTAYENEILRQLADSKTYVQFHNN